MGEGLKRAFAATRATRKRKKDKPALPILHNREPVVRDSRLVCGNCGEPFTITVSGMICACPGMRRHWEHIDDLRQKYPRQISECPADKFGGERQ